MIETKPTGSVTTSNMILILISLQICLFSTLYIEKEYASYLYLSSQKADIPRQALLLINFVKLANGIASASLL